MKASLIKTMEEGEDMDLALLTYKTTPLSHRLPSPAELLNSRKYKTLLPTRIVPTRLQESYRQIMDQGKQIEAQLYNKNTRVLPRLEQSQKVVVQLDPDKKHQDTGWDNPMPNLRWQIIQSKDYTWSSLIQEQEVHQTRLNCSRGTSPEANQWAKHDQTHKDYQEAR